MIARRARPVSPTLWILGPTLAVIAITLLLSIPLRVLGLQLPEPVFALVPAFAWALVRPSVWPPLALGALGICLDLIWGSPTGLWSVCLLAAFAFVFFLRRNLAGQDVGLLWIAYGAACGVAFAVGEALSWMRSGQPPGLTGVGLQLGVTIALFPFAWRLVERYESSDTRY